MSSAVVALAQLAIVLGVLILFVLGVVWLLRRAKQGHEWITYTFNIDDTRSWCHCHGCSHAFIVSPYGEYGLYWDNESRSLRPECPQCGLRHDGTKVTPTPFVSEACPMCGHVEMNTECDHCCSP